MKNIKKYSLFALFLSLSFTAVSQNKALKIGDNPTLKDPSTVLELESTNKGFLAPRVALTDLKDITTITPTATGAAAYLTVFNTATAGTVPNNVYPGYYYWRKDVVPANSTWVRILDWQDSPWLISGNSATNVPTAAPSLYSGDFIAPTAGNYLGTGPLLTPAIGVPSQDLQIRTNGVDAMRIMAKDQSIAIGNAHYGTAPQSSTYEAGTNPSNFASRFAINDNLSATGIKTNVLPAVAGGRLYTPFKINFDYNNDEALAQVSYNAMNSNAVYSGDKDYVNAMGVQSSVKLTGSGSINASAGFQANVQHRVTGAGSLTKTTYGINLDNNFYTGNLGTQNGIRSNSSTEVGSIGNVDELNSIWTYSVLKGAAVVDHYNGIKNTIISQGAIITGEAIGINLSIGSTSGGDANFKGKTYGIKILDLLPGFTAITPGTNDQYGIYQMGANDINYFNGNTGIGTNAPKTTLQVNGSLTMKIRTSTASAETVAANDYTIVLKYATPGGSTLTLPDPTTCEGRILVIVNLSEGLVTLNYGLIIGNNNPTTLPTYNTINDIGFARSLYGLNHTNLGNKMTIQSTGTEWLVIAN